MDGEGTIEYALKYSGLPINADDGVHKTTRYTTAQRRKFKA